MLPDFAHADWMVWTHAATIEALQHAYNGLRRTCPLGRASRPVWSSAAVHRPAEFNKTHVPAFLAGEAPGAYLCVYPFVRSYDWYLLHMDSILRWTPSIGRPADNRTALKLRAASFPGAGRRKSRPRRSGHATRG